MGNFLSHYYSKLFRFFRLCVSDMSCAVYPPSFFFLLSIFNTLCFVLRNASGKPFALSSSPPCTLLSTQPSNPSRILISPPFNKQVLLLFPARSLPSTASVVEQDALLLMSRDHRLFSFSIPYPIFPFRHLTFTDEFPCSCKRNLRDLRFN